MALFSGFRKKYSHRQRTIRLAVKSVFNVQPVNIYIYELAFRHKSAAPEIINGYRDSNERLEFLGDAILSAIVSDYLFRKFPYKSEGELTNLRSKCVNRNFLNETFEKLGLMRLIEVKDESRLYFKSLPGNTLEALIGALYIDKGFDTCREVIVEKVLFRNVSIEEVLQKETNHKSKIIEWAQKEKVSFEFKKISEKSLGYTKEYEVAVSLSNKIKGTGIGSTIKDAEQNAAMNACYKLGLIKND